MKNLTQLFQSKNSTFKTILLITILQNVFLINDANFCDSSSSRKRSLELINPKRLGKGSFGTVYGDGTYAVKNMKVPKYGDEKTFLSREIAVTLAFDDPSFARAVSEGCYYEKVGSNYEVQLKLLQYESDFQKALNKYRIQGDVWKADTIFKILAAMKKMHDNNFCHFDLKEINLFSMNKYTPVLGDFGLSQTPQQAQRSGFWGGTENYLGYKVAKNIFSNFPYENCTADLYALGVIIYHIIVQNTNAFINTESVKSAQKSNPSNYLLQKFAPRLTKMLAEVRYPDAVRGSVSDALYDITKIIQEMMTESQFSTKFQNYLNEEESYYQNPTNPPTRTFQSQLKNQFTERKKIYEINYDVTTTEALNQYCKISKIPNGIITTDYLFYSPSRNTLNNENFQIHISNKPGVKQTQIRNIVKDIRQTTIKYNKKPVYSSSSEENDVQYVHKNKKPAFVDIVPKQNGYKNKFVEEDQQPQNNNQKLSYNEYMDMILKRGKYAENGKQNNVQEKKPSERKQSPLFLKKKPVYNFQKESNKPDEKPNYKHLSREEYKDMILKRGKYAEAERDSEKHLNYDQKMEKKYYDRMYQRGQYAVKKESSSEENQKPQKNYKHLSNDEYMDMILKRGKYAENKPATKNYEAKNYGVSNNYGAKNYGVSNKYGVKSSVDESYMDRLNQLKKKYVAITNNKNGLRNYIQII